MTTSAKTSASKPTPARKPAIRSNAAATAASKAAARVAAPAAPDFTKRYKMLTGIDNSEFCAKVRLHLDNGYELHGSPAMAFNGKDIIVGQAVVLKKLPTKKKAGKKK